MEREKLVQPHSLANALEASAACLHPCNPLSVSISYLYAAFRFMYWPDLHHPVRTEPSRDLRGEAALRIWQREGQVEEAANAAYQVLVGAIVDCQQAGLLAPGDPAPLALTAWCTVHGLAALLLNNPQRSEEARAQAEQLSLIVTGTLAQGLMPR